MAFNTYEQHELYDDFGTYPSPPTYPPPPPHPPRPATRPRHARHVPPPPAHPPSIPARGSTELARLRTSYRWLRRTMTLTALGYFAAYLCMAGFLPDVMGTQLFGSTLNLGVVLGLLQVPVTLGTVIGYEYVARAFVDPAAHRVRITDAERYESVEDTW